MFHYLQCLIRLMLSSRSPSLVKIAHTRGQHGAIVADGLMLPHPAARFDFFISIAVIHHFATRERRVAAIRELLDVLKPSPSGLEESGPSAAQGLIYVWALEQKTSRRGWDIDNPQDVMVPWVTKKRPGPHTERSQAGSSCHGLYRDQQSPGNSEPIVSQEKTVTLQRYYHLYRAGELQEDIVAGGGVVLTSGYEKDNWWATAQRAL